MRTPRTLMPLALAAVAATAFAQPRDFPQRPVRVIVPVPPGGSVDATARLLAPKLSESLGQQVLIDNRAGASTNIGMEVVARAPGDGYTLLANTAPLVANPALFPKLGFAPEKDFAPISLVVNGPVVVVAHPSLPVRDLQGLVRLQLHLLALLRRRRRRRQGLLGRRRYVSGMGGDRHLGFGIGLHLRCSHLGSLRLQLLHPRSFLG